jgi:hypothetical protein
MSVDNITPSKMPIFDQMLSQQNEFFIKNTKNQFFKKNQKFDCAKYISKTLNINEMIEEAVFILPGKNVIVIDYLIFKIFANEENYDNIIAHIMNLFDYAIQYYSGFEVNLNLRTFTVSAAERYIPAIKKFCDRCLNDQTKYTEFMKSFRILNNPAVMEMIITVVKPFVEKDVIQKLTFLNKTETAEYCKDTKYVLKSDCIQK